MILAEEVKAMRAIRLKVGVLSFLTKSHTGMRYVVNTRNVFRWASDEEFATCVATLVEQSLITQTQGRQGGPRLTLVEGEPYGK